MSSNRVEIRIDIANINDLNKLRKALDDVDKASDNASSGLDDFSRSSSNAGRSSGGLLGTIGKMKGVFLAVGSAVAGLGLASLGGQIVSAQREFDVLNAQLITATGGAEQASAAFKELQQFAKETPYGLAQAVEGYTKLKNLGLDPSIESMKSFGNTASAMGKDLNQMIEAVADATTGEFERLKEFGIKAKKEGDQVALTFQGVTTTIGNNASEIQQYLIDLGNNEFAGAMETRAKTLDGAISTIGDSWQGLLLTISSGGIGDALTDIVNNASDIIDGISNKLSDPAVMEQFRVVIEGIGTAFSAIGEAGGQLADILGQIGEAFSTALEHVKANEEIYTALGIAVGSAVTAFGLLTGISMVVTWFTSGAAAVAIFSGAFSVLMGMATAFGTVMAFVTSPITLIAVAIGAVVAAGYLLYRNWDLVKAKALEVWNAVKQYATDAWAGVENVWSGFTAWVSGIWNGLKESASSAWEGVKSVFTLDFLANLGQGVQSFFSGVIAEVENFFLVTLPESWAGLKESIMAIFTSAPGPVQEMVANILSIVDVLIMGVSMGFELWLTGATAVWNSIVAVISGAISVITSVWDGIVTVASVVASGVTAVWNGVVSTLSSIWAGIVAGATAAWNTIKSVAISVWDGVKSAVSNAINAIKPIISGIASFFASAWNGLVSIANSVWNGIKSAITVALTVIKAVITAQVTGFAHVFNAGFALVKNVFVTFGNVVRALVRGDMEGVKSAFRAGLSNAVSIVSGLLNNIWATFKDLGSKLLQAGRDAIQGFINGITEKMGEALARVRELASKVMSTVREALDIRSPSREMAELGRYTADGMAVGIKQNTPKAVKKAKQMAEQVKKTVADEVANLKREIALLSNDDPLAGLNYDIAHGKYAGANTSELSQLTAELAVRKSTQSVLDDIRSIERDIAIAGLNRLQAFEWELANTDKYKGISEDVLNSKRQILQLEIDTNEQLAERNRLEQANKAVLDKIKANKKTIALRGNTDPHASELYDMRASGVSEDNISAWLDSQKTIDSYARQDKAKTAFDQLSKNMSTQGESPMDKLRREYKEKLAIVDEFEEAHNAKTEESAKRRAEIEKQYADSKRDLMLTEGQSLFGELTKMTEMFGGKQSKAYRAMFAIEKGFAIARSIVAIQQALALASANPFPMNMGAIATVASQTASIIGNIKSVAMPVGQAHDGIMSVPKSGTWNLEKGERVLPEHTAKAMDRTLANINGGGGGGIVNIVINVASDGSSTADAQGSSQTAKVMADKIKAVVLETLRQERKQGGLLYA